MTLAVLLLAIALWATSFLATTKVAATERTFFLTGICPLFYAELRQGILPKLMNALPLAATIATFVSDFCRHSPASAMTHALAWSLLGFAGFIAFTRLGIRQAERHFLRAR